MAPSSKYASQANALRRSALSGAAASSRTTAPSTFNYGNPDEAAIMAGRASAAASAAGSAYGGASVRSVGGASGRSGLGGASGGACGGAYGGGASGIPTSARSILGGASARQYGAIAHEPELTTGVSGNTYRVIEVSPISRGGSGALASSRRSEAPSSRTVLPASYLAGSDVASSLNRFGASGLEVSTRSALPDYGSVSRGSGALVSTRPSGSHALTTPARPSGTSAMPSAIRDMIPAGLRDMIPASGSRPSGGAGSSSTEILFVGVKKATSYE